MSRWLLVDLAAAALYLGFQLTVHVVVYRQFDAVPPAAFAAYVRAHQRRISYVVGPLFAALVASTAGVLIDRPAGAPAWTAVASAALVAAVLGVTGGLAVPLHRRLSSGWDEAAWRQLLTVDALRVAAATANLAVVAVMALA